MLTVLTVPTYTPQPILEYVSSTLSMSNEDTGAHQSIYSLPPTFPPLAPPQTLRRARRLPLAKAKCQAAAGTEEEVDRPVEHRQITWIHHTTYLIDDRPTHPCPSLKISPAKRAVRIQTLPRRYLR